MKTILHCTSLAGMLAASAFAQILSSPTSSGHVTARYEVTDLGTFGGTFSIAYGINNGGQVGGAAGLPNGNLHAFLTGLATREQEMDGLDLSLQKTDLGTLGGPNSAANRPNGRGDVPIISETSTPDPLGEDFCNFANHLTCLGALWRNGVLTPLPTLGGNNAITTISNNRGQIVGLAENNTHDSTCSFPSQVLRFEAAMWGPEPGKIQGLPPLPGDTVGYALGINERSQVVGASGNCANTGPTPVGLFIGQHAVLWENGMVKDLGNLGGKMMGKAGAINDRGEVAGFSDLPSGQVVSFLWTKDTGMHSLGALGADILGDPAGINNNTQVVGGSCDASGNCRAFFWERNVMSDLNDLIPSDSPLYLVYALGVNDAGEIVGFAAEKSSGELHAYLASPAHGQSGQKSVTPAVQAVTEQNQQVTIPENIRMLLQRRVPFGGHRVR